MRKEAHRTMPAQADINFESELWEAAVALRGVVAPADYKHCVLPLLFLRYLSLRYEQRYRQIEAALKEPASDYFTGDPEIDAEVLAEPDEVEPIHAVLPPEGLFLGTFVDTEEEADGLLKKAARWSARGNHFARP